MITSQNSKSLASLICVCQVFDKMAERYLVSIFCMNFGECTGHILGSIWLLGFDKVHWFGWVLRNGDLTI